MSKILILFAHPALEKSKANLTLLKHIHNLPGITFNDLYQIYPDFDIDIKREQELLLQHQIIIWQHPFYWYSGPAMLKQWMDLVLEHGWAYGQKGFMLNGKKIFNAFTSGGSHEAYQFSGHNKCTVQEMLRPYERTAQLCRMKYLPPFWVPGTHKLEKHQLEAYGVQYRDLLIALRDDLLNEKEIEQVGCLNDLVPAQKILQ